MSLNEDIQFDGRLTNQTLSILKNEERNNDDLLECNPKFLLLCNRVNRKQIKKNDNTCKDLFFSGFNDYPQERTSFLFEESPEISDKRKETGVESTFSLENELISIIRSEKTSVREIIDLVSNVCDKTLESDLFNTWQKLRGSSDKLKFVELLSFHPACSIVMCRKILLVELKKKGNFHSAMELIKPHIQLFQSQAISELLISLLVDKDSFVSGETAWLKDIIPLLSLSQKSEILGNYIEIMEKTTQQNHLQMLSLLLEEIQLNDQIIERLVQLFSRNLSNFVNDRFFGKILLTILECLPEGIHVNVIKELSQLCNSYKGVMRFRINTALKKFNQ